VKRTLLILLVVAVVAVVINDGGRYARATIDLHNSTSQILDSAVLGASHMSQQQLAQQIGNLAATQQIHVVQFASGPDGVTLWTEEDVPGTWVLGPYLAMTRGVSYKQAWATPFAVKYQATQALR
jgi:hypothetical protein